MPEAGRNAAATLTTKGVGDADRIETLPGQVTGAAALFATLGTMSLSQRSMFVSSASSRAAMILPAHSHHLRATADRRPA